LEVLTSIMAPDISVGCVDSEETGLCTNFGFHASQKS